MKIVSSTEWVPARSVDIRAKPGREVYLGRACTVRVHTEQGLEYMSLPEGTMVKVIRVVKVVKNTTHAEWEVTLPTPKLPRVRPISRRQLVRVLENPEVFAENTMARPSKDYRPYALSLNEEASLSEGLAVMLRLSHVRIPLPLPYTGQSGGLYRAIDQLPVWARIIMPDDRSGPMGTTWERVFQKTPKGWRDCGLRRKATC